MHTSRLQTLSEEVRTGLPENHDHTLLCRACALLRPIGMYSRKQLKRKGRRKCVSCIEGAQDIQVPESKTLRCDGMEMKTELPFPFPTLWDGTTPLMTGHFYRDLPWVDQTSAEMLDTLESDTMGTGLNPYDYHCWVLDLNTHTIIDPFFEEYLKIQEIKQCTGKAVYQSFSPKITQDIFRQVMTYAIKPNIPDREAYVSVVARMLKRPQFGWCHLNAYARQQETPGRVLMIGRLGWRRSVNHEIYWEFG
jgi:hypothetical protein